MKFGKMVLPLLMGTLASLPAFSQERTIGVHLISHHTPSRDYNNVNPGVYYSDSGIPCGNGMVAGIYKNSFHRSSVYAGCYMSLFESGSLRLDVLGGLSTGYQKNQAPIRVGDFALVVVPSLRIKVAPEMAARISFRPRLGDRHSAVIHFSMEHSF